MKHLPYFAILFFLLLFFSSCAGIQYLSIETREPAQVTLPAEVNSVLVVNNVVKQPDDIGHNIKRLGKKQFDNIKVSADSVAIFYTEALAQFLDEEEYFGAVKYYQKPLRSDTDFWKELPIQPETMNELRRSTATDAIISLDKLLLQTEWVDFFQQEGVKYAGLTGKIQSVIRVYLPSMEGKIPSIQFHDSLKWEGYDTRGRLVFAELTLPTQEEALKQLAVYAAEKMTKVFSPHWERQDRWYYTHFNSRMREGAVYARGNQWLEAIEKWNEFYTREKKMLNRAKAAHNIALAYEMLDEMESAYEWATVANDLFRQSTSPSSLERRRSALFKKEIERRRDASRKLNMQIQ
jgi:tetratricopeptide (TPR) repeat protein